MGNRPYTWTVVPPSIEKIYRAPGEDYSGADPDPGETASLFTFLICGLIVLGALVRVTCFGTSDKTKDYSKVEPSVKEGIELVTSQDEKSCSKENVATNVANVVREKVR